MCVGVLILPLYQLDLLTYFSYLPSYNIGIKEPAAKLGITFVSGKFDQNNSSMPLSAFVDAMLSLTNLVIGSDRGYKIQHEINETFREEEILLIAKTLPGCEVGLFPMQREEIYRKRASQYGGSKVTIGNEARLQYETMTLMGKSAITCLHNKIRRLLQIICKHLQGVVLFIDDLQVSKRSSTKHKQTICTWCLTLSTIISFSSSL